MHLTALNQQEAATLLSVTPRTLRDWEKAGEGIPRNRDGTYSAAALVAWFVERSTGEGLDANQERARKDKESADKLAMENAVRRGELAPTSVLAEIHGDEVARARARLIQIPDAVGQRFDPSIAPRIIVEVRRLIYEAMAELAGGAAQLPKGAERAVDAPADADGERVGGLRAAPVKRKQRRARPVAD